MTCSRLVHWRCLGFLILFYIFYFRVHLLHILISLFVYVNAAHGFCPALFGLLIYLGLFVWTILFLVVFVLLPYRLCIRHSLSNKFSILLDFRLLFLLLIVLLFGDGFEELGRLMMCHIFLSDSANLYLYSAGFNISLFRLLSKNVFILSLVLHYLLKVKFFLFLFLFYHLSVLPLKLLLVVLPIFLNFLM